MALILSAASGNFNTAATWAGGVVPVLGDEARASTGHTITISGVVTCTEVSNAGTGKYTLNNGATLNANVTQKGSAGYPCVQFIGTGIATISGNITGSGNGATNQACVTLDSSGTLNIAGNVTGGSGVLGNAIATTQPGGIINITSTEIRGGTGSQSRGVSNTTNCTINISGIVIAGSGATCHGLSNDTNGQITITGNVFGGAGSSDANGLINASTGVVTITGSCTGNSSPGVLNSSTGTIAIAGSCIGGNNNSGAVNASTGLIRVRRAVGNNYGPGNTAGLSARVGISNSALGICEVQEIEYGANGQSPTSGSGIRLKKANTNVATFNYCDTEGAKTLIDATANAAMPAATDVRSGVSYASGALTGSCAVPAAGSTALGVPVDATFGTAVLTPEAVWGATSRTLTAGAGISASDVWAYNSRTLTTSSGPTAVEIRQEIDANSTKLDAAISSRLAGSAYTAPTTPPTAAEIATAVEGSLLNEADGQAVLNALVGAIGNQNVSEVSLVAAIRSDIERTGGKLDSVPTAAANASAVWGTASKQITGGTVDTLTNSPSVPSAASIAAATRAELAVELARVDTAVSSRMAGSESTKLDAVKAKTDALNTERLQNCATTAIVGNLIAQANS